MPRADDASPRATFDAVAGDYDRIMQKTLGGFGSDIDYYAEYKAMAVARALGRKPRSVLEFGCGTGRNIRFLAREFPGIPVAGCDISEASLAVARAACPGHEFFVPDDRAAGVAAHDLVLVACVLHHVPMAQRAGTMRQIAGYMAAGGDLFIFEENPLNPVTRRIMRSSPFDRDSAMLRAGETAELVRNAGLEVCACRYTLFVPAALRRLAFIERFLAWLPMGAQYYVHARALRCAV
jgi:SAM-dependent methyltransferase